jgi:acyl-CoA thioesterase-2
MKTAPLSVPPPSPRHLHEVLDLEQLDTNLFRSRVNQVGGNRSLYGGQILGQGLKAAALTAPAGRTAHSLHGYFLLPGMCDIPVIYDVELTRDGGSFSTRRVVARQRARPIFHMELSFHREEQGFEHELAPEVEVPDPEQLASMQALVESYADRVPDDLAQMQPTVELRPICPEDFFLRKAARSRCLYWLKSASPLPADSLTHAAALAYLSDYFLVFTALLEHKESTFSRDVRVASLDHAMWFHRPCRADEWLLIEAASPFAGGARGLTRGQIYDRDRRLVASVAQEGMMRRIE